MPTHPCWGERNSLCFRSGERYVSVPISHPRCFSNRRLPTSQSRCAQPGEGRAPICKPRNELSHPSPSHLENSRLFALLTLARPLASKVAHLERNVFFRNSLSGFCSFSSEVILVNRFLHSSQLRLSHLFVLVMPTPLRRKMSSRPLFRFMTSSS